MMEFYLESGETGLAVRRMASGVGTRAYDKIGDEWTARFARNRS